MEKLKRGLPTFGTRRSSRWYTSWFSRPFFGHRPKSF